MESIDPLANLRSVCVKISKDIEDIEKKEKCVTDPEKKSELESKKNEKLRIQRSLINTAKTQTLISVENDALKRALKEEDKLLRELPSSNILAKSSQSSLKSSLLSSLKSREEDHERLKAPGSQVEKHMKDIKDLTTRNAAKINEEVARLEAELLGFEKELASAKKNLQSLTPKEMESVRKNLGSIKDTKDNIASLKARKGELDSVQDNAILNSLAHYIKKYEKIEEENALKRIREDNKKSQQVDLCFLLDGTGSMDSWIEMTKQKVLDIIKGVKETYSESQFRIATVVYRDFDMGSRSFEVSQFSENPHTVPDFLKRVVATGGSDQAEDINGGFQRVLRDLQWQNMTKVLIHFADAPCHGKQFGSTNDYHPDPPSDIDWIKIFREVKSLGIDYNFMRINDSTDVMTAEFAKLWNMAGKYYGTNHKKIEFKVHSATTNTTDFVNKIKSAIISSIRKSESYMRSGSSLAKYEKSGRPRRIDEVVAEEDEEDGHSFPQPNWSVPKYQWEVKKGKVISVSIKNIEHILLHGLKTFEGDWEIQVQKSPFAKGSFNTAFAAIHASSGHKLVAKKPQEIDENLLKLDLKKKGVAISLARDFNKDLAKLKHFGWARLFFIQTFLFASSEDPKDLWLLEGHIDGDFKKYSNNLDEIDQTQEIRHFTAFSHYSYQKSKGEFLVTDFQGVGSFLLTDPALHSRSKEFIESGDFGFEGFIRFFSKHQCNDICRGLKLERPALRLDECSRWLEKPYSHSAGEIKRKCWSLLCNQELKKDEKQYCSLCFKLTSEKVKKPCVSCKKDFEYSRYTYTSAGLKEPKKCPKCGKHKKRPLADLFGESEGEES